MLVHEYIYYKCIIISFHKLVPDTVGLVIFSMVESWIPQYIYVNTSRFNSQFILHRSR